MKIEAQFSLSPRPEPTAFEEAAEAWKRQDYEKTIEILKRATRQQPDNTGLLLNLAEAYGLRFEYREAEHWLEKAVAVAVDKVQVLAEAGRRCNRFNRAAMANSYFKRAAEHSNVSPSVLVALAEFEEGHSRTEAALALVERALEAQRGYPDAVLARARLHRLGRELEKGEQLLRDLLPKAVGETAIKAWYELGTNLDRQGSYDAAMAAFLQAKAQLRPSSTPHVAEIEAIHAEIRRSEEMISADALRRWRATGAELQPRRRFALLCGHPRSGTTLLEHALDAHPDIIATDETSFLLGEAYPRLRREARHDAPLIDVLESASMTVLQNARADYFRLAESFVGESIGDRLLIDKNPALDVHIPFVARLFPETAFLVAIRDPRDVCLSCFMLPLPPGRLSALYLSLERTAAQYAFVMGFSRAIRSRLPGPQMEVRYEDTVADLRTVSRRMLEFLGVEWNPAVLRFDEHARSRFLRCGIDEAVTKPIFASSIGRWRRYQKYLEPCFEQLAPYIKAFGYD
jgi:tetratricopeptide (TPR) repeat protein